jgi:hypothetical protein
VQRIAILCFVLAVACLLLLLWHGGRTGGPALTASWTRTPGVLNPDVHQETIGQTICVSGWTRTIRPPTAYTSELKAEQMREYGVGGSPSGYQEDHLISLELGGHPTDRRNLWPEPRPRAEAVDRIENQLREQVCSGALTLAEAQEKISEIKHSSG